MLYNHITDLIGNTPLLKIDPKIHGLKHIDMYAKLEYYNPFGSVKDRIAWGMIKDDIHTIAKKNQTIIEASSGNTVKALQLLGSVHGIPVEAMTNRIKVDEVRQLLKLMGAEVTELPGLSECPDPTAPQDVFSMIKERMAGSPDKYYYPSQYTNEKNTSTHYETTGQEIFNDLGSIDYLIGGLGTAGSTAGTSRALKKHNNKLATIGVVAGGDDFIPGIRTIHEMWEVGLFDKANYTSIEEVSSHAAIDGMITLLRRSGITGGPTTGAAFVGALQYLRSQDKPSKHRKKAVFIASDRIEWYVSYLRSRRPDLFGEISVEDDEPEYVDVLPILPHQLDRQRRNKDVFVLDIRGQAAYDFGHIPGALNIRDDLLLQLLREGEPFPRHMQFIIACAAGKRSEAVAGIMQQKGYEVSHLHGGIGAWRDAGYEMEITTPATDDE